MQPGHGDVENGARFPHPPPATTTDKYPTGRYANIPLGKIGQVNLGKDWRENYRQRSESITPIRGNLSCAIYHQGAKYVKV